MFVVKLDIKRHVFESTGIKLGYVVLFFGSDFLAYADPESRLHKSPPIYKYRVMFNTICTAFTVKMSQLPLKYPKEFSNCYYNSFPTFFVQNQKELKIV